MNGTLYLVRNVHCDHILAAWPARESAQKFIDMLNAAGHWGWRVRTGGTDDDLAALIQGERCERCSLDGEVLAP